MTSTMQVIQKAAGSAVPEPSPTRDYYDQTPPGEIFDSEDELHDLPPILPTDEPIVAVIGVGYVGEHLVNAFAGRCRVIGLDVSAARVDKLKLENTTGTHFTTKSSDIAPATHFLISVPTLLLPNQQVDSSYLRQAIAVAAKHSRPGATAVIESSVAVGMTRELLGPLAKAKTFAAVGMSPERVDPGRSFPPATSIPKVVSGLDDVAPGSTDAIARLYLQAFDDVVRVSRPEVAEMMKLYENCQRMVCIAYANEMADACHAHGIDPFEVCRAAATKPFGYMPFAPGIGVGGHCIPVNPFYLLSNSDFPLLRSAAEKMRARPGILAQRIIDRLQHARRGVVVADQTTTPPPQQQQQQQHVPTVPEIRPRVLVVGIGFKPGQSHLANSPGLELAKNLVISGVVDVAWADPLVAQEAVPQIRRLDESCWTRKFLGESFDIIVAAIRQDGIDFGVLRTLPPSVVEWWFV